MNKLIPVTALEASPPSIRAEYGTTHHKKFVAVGARILAHLIATSWQPMLTSIFCPHPQHANMILALHRHAMRRRTTLSVALLVATTFLVHGFQRILVVNPSKKAKFSAKLLAPASKNDSEIEEKSGRTNAKISKSKAVTEAVFASTPASSKSGLPVVPTRKTKKNKYADFSKADKIEQDPFDALVEESQRKLLSLQDATDPIKRKEEEIAF